MSAPDQLGRLCSFYLYYTTAMTDTLLWRAIRLLVGGDATAVPTAAPGRSCPGTGPTRRSTTGRRTRRTLTTGLTRARDYGRSPVRPM